MKFIYILLIPIFQLFATSSDYVDLYTQTEFKDTEGNGVTTIKFEGQSSGVSVSSDNILSGQVITCDDGSSGIEVTTIHSEFAKKVYFNSCTMAKIKVLDN